MFRYCLGLAVLLVGAQGVSAQPAHVVIIRHAEKPPEGSELSLKGRERAAALSPYFRGDALKVNTPIAIYAQTAKHTGSSVRPIETVTPLANALHVKIDESFARDDYKSLVEHILHEKKYHGHTVLICWEHNVIPHMAEAFGVADAPKDWKGKAFDRAWVISFNGHEKPTFRDESQQLMYGDSDQ